jgi:hypothetical protein
MGVPVAEDMAVVLAAVTKKITPVSSEAKFRVPVAVTPVATCTVAVDK